MLSRIRDNNDWSSVCRFAENVNDVKFPAGIGQKAEYTLDKVHHRADAYRETFTHASTCTTNLESPNNLLTTCLWTVGGNRSTRRQPMPTQGEHHHHAAQTVVENHPPKKQKKNMLAEEEMLVFDNQP